MTATIISFPVRPANDAFPPLEPMTNFHRGMVEFQAEKKREAAMGFGPTMDGPPEGCNEGCSRCALGCYAVTKGLLKLNALRLEQAKQMHNGYSA